MTARGTSPARPTLRQVASLSGVSIKTASRVLNDEQYVAEATARRVRSAAAQLGFRPNTLARDFRAGARSTSVGLIIGDVANPFYARIARGAERRLRAAGMQLITASTDEDEQFERALIGDMLERRLRALMVVSSDAEHAYLDAERRHGTPIVFLDRPPRDLVADSVVLDNASGVRQAVEHFIEHKHRRIALVGDLSRLSTQRERFAAFRDTMIAAGLTKWDRYVRPDSHDVDAAEHAVMQLLDDQPAPTALLTTNNRITIGALRALRDVPDPPALIGFDDFELAELLDISVVAHDPEQMGALGADLVLNRLEHPDRTPQHKVLPTTLVTRGSGERRPLRSVRANSRS